MRFFLSLSLKKNPKRKKTRKKETKTRTQNLFSFCDPRLDPVGSQPLQQRLLSDSTLPLRHRNVTARVEQRQRRQAVDFVLFDQIRARVGVDLDDFQFSVELLLDRGHQRGDELAGPAPDGPEVDEDRDRGLEVVFLCCVFFWEEDFFLVRGFVVF